MIDSAFYEQEQSQFGESRHFARGKIANCPHLGLIVGQFSGGQDWFYSSSLGGTGIADRVANVLAYWPYRTNDQPFNPNAALKPRGFWRFDITLNVYFGVRSDPENGLPGLPVMIVMFDPAVPFADSNVPTPQLFLLRESGSAFVTQEINGWAPPEDGFNPQPGSNQVYNRPSFVLPAAVLPGSFSKQLTLHTTTPPPRCHPGFGLGNVDLSVGAPPGEHYYRAEFLGAPTLAPGDNPVPIWDFTCTVRRVFPFTPFIRITQTRFNFSAVNQAEISNPPSDIYRVEFAEVGYTDNGAKNNWNWTFDGSAVAGLPNMTRDYASGGEHTVAVSVMDGNLDVYNSGTQRFRLKTVEWSVTNGAGAIRNFDSSAIDPGNSSVSSYLWTFASGILTSDILGTSTAANPSFNYGSTLAADRMARLQVTFADGAFYRTTYRYVG